MFQSIFQVLNFIVFCGYLTSIKSLQSSQKRGNVQRMPLVIHAKSNRPSSQGNVEKYLQMKELMRLKNEGATYEELKTASINGTKPNIKWKEQAALISLDDKAKVSGGYKKYVGKKGTLDQRLRAIVAYKRTNVAIAEAEALDQSPGLTTEEEIELEQMMEDNEDDDDLIDDEELQYESLILKVIEKNKLSEVKRNLAMDLRLQSRERYSDKKSNESTEITADEDVERLSRNESQSEPQLSGNSSATAQDLYTPARHSWGVFQRPRDISKSYGGGRTISKAEMDRLDEEYEAQQKKKTDAQKIIMTESQQLELKNTPLIKDTLSRSRGFMSMGNREAAVEVLESVQDKLSWQSDLGGEVLLELGMALETVDRPDDARKIYGKLASTNWSQKIRRNSMQLISGLDIVKQIRKDISPAKPAMDYENMKLISMALEKGLSNEWNDFKKDKQYSKDSQFRPWFDNEEGKLDKIVNVNTVNEAYNLLMRELNPLKKITSELLQKSFRRLYLSRAGEKLEFAKQKRKQNLALQANSYSPTQYRRTSSAVFTPYTEDPTGSIPLVSANRELDYSYNETRHFVNGSWDLVSSLVDSTPYSARRFDLGAVRRSVDLEMLSCIETFPVLWGLGTAVYSYDLSWNAVLDEVTLTGNALKNSKSPWQKASRSSQIFQVLYCDDQIMVTRQVSDKVSDPDLYLLWKRMKETVWIKY